MIETEVYQPLLPIPEIPVWSERLRQLSRQPLSFCADLPDIAERCEAWWAHDCLDRPVFTGSANKNRCRPITRRLELLDQPAAWFEEVCRHAAAAPRGGCAPLHPGGAAIHAGRPRRQV